MKYLPVHQFIVILLLCTIPAFAQAQGSHTEKLWGAIQANKSQELEQLFTANLIRAKDLNPKCTAMGRCKPLIVALHRKASPDIIKTLVNHGADVNANSSDEMGNTPLLYAMQNNDREMIDFLLKRGADVNKTNRLGVSPFFGACLTGNLDLVRLFLRHGAKINGRASLRDPLRQTEEPVRNITPLMLAASTGNTEVSDFLLANGASIGLKDSLGRTASDYHKAVKIKSRGGAD